MINKITIVGGGTAAWLTAAWFGKYFWDREITVIDKEAGKPIGVGEATVLTFADFMNTCGFPIEEWFEACDGTFKNGIVFPDWQKKGRTIWHPFFVNVSHFELECTHFDIWANKFQDRPFNSNGTLLWPISQKNKVDVYNTLDSIAYHVDASKLVLFLQNKCNSLVKLIKSEVVNVNRNEKGDITSLDLNNGTTHEADFFIDCTGFNNILKKPDKVNLIEEGRLFTNTAVCGQIPFEDKEKELMPYARCPAVDHGWIWKIPTQSRIGSGMVFNRDITDIDTAKQYFSDHWNGRIKPEDLRVIDWTPYYSRNFWENNVVSIGLSGGFVEPLESTGIASITDGIQKLAVAVNTNRYDQGDIDLYNQQMMNWYDDVVDFIHSHYADSTWDTPFWNYVKERHKKSEKHLWYEQWLKDPNDTMYSKNATNTIFHPPNWQIWLIQMGYKTASDLRHVSPVEIDRKMFEFLHEEEKRQYTSLDHANAIEATNKGARWRNKAGEQSV